MLKEKKINKASEGYKVCLKYEKQIRIPSCPFDDSRTVPIKPKSNLMRLFSFYLMLDFNEIFKNLESLGL